MGLFKFIKDAGTKLFGGSAQAATPDTLKQTVEGHGFDASKLAIDVQGDKVKLSGQAMSQEEAEKLILSLGNTYGVAEVDTSGLKVEKSAEQSTMYTVQKGDTLWEIAEKHYGKGKGAKHTEIVKANSPPVKNPDMIQPGWVLRIPPLAG
ncbi:peptidoglycan-binding protein LysM [Microvirga splendida]|uniref:Peptidoglycan-binding protein LysM n=1 Tax=Microvirga splendida TaxID=2795727 RepID=A0ABS0XXQ5_9HYPH|nr:peptidoglycan-binding protein LysM [Microvirga splendida]MBJ6124831.1 peptidoglycan-binding protein LysM [Microvirga splendida]